MTPHTRLATRLGLVTSLTLIYLLGASAMAATQDDTTFADYPSEPVALSGKLSDYTQAIRAGNGRFRVTYRGGMEEIRELFPRGQGTGVGVLEGPLTEPDKLWEMARHAICEGKDFGGMQPGDGIFSGGTRCANGEGKGITVGSSSRGKDAQTIVGVLNAQFLPYYKQGMGPQGNRPVWLEAEIYLAPVGDKLKITLRLINSGKEDIVVRTPEQWEGSYNPLGEGYTAFGGSGYNDLGQEILFDDIGGSSLAPGQNFPDGRWVIPGGQSRDAVFLVYPKGPFLAGTYIAGGRLDFLHVLSPDSLKGSVEMWLRQTTGNRFDSNYPADDASLARLEAARREHDKFLPALPVGRNVTESGWYRAVHYVNGNEQRSDVPRLFHTGDTLPAEPLIHLTAKGKQAADIATGWRWEAYLEAQVTGHSRERCPRSGLWVPTLPADAPAYLSAHVQPMHMEAGQPMLAIGLPDAALESRVVWTWIGDGAP